VDEAAFWAGAGLRIILGIDPGASGAIARLTAMGDLQIWDMPTRTVVRNGKEKRELDVTRLATILEEAGASEACVEQVGARPGQGVTSMFAFGRAVGQVEGALAACALPIHYVTPQVWRRRLAVPAGKSGSRLRASELMPAYATEWRRAKDDGRAEAALIAMYALLNLGGHA